MEYSKGNWIVGKTVGAVVTDCPDGFPTKTGHDDTEYYGGYLIAESILKPADAHLITAAPDLLKANKETLEYLRWIANQNFNLWSDNRQELYRLIAQSQDAINKSQGITKIEFEEDES